jgi:toxin ParE1/3/4
VRLRYKARSLGDIERIRGYISQFDARATDGVAERIERAINRLMAFPLSGRRGTIEGTRLLVVPNLPYIVVYRVTEDTIDIISVLHTARRRRS